MADWRLVVAAVLLGLAAVAHSYLGERYILMRLFRRTPLPRIGPDDWFTRRTMRFAWHLTSVTWLGFGVVVGAYGVGALAVQRWPVAVSAAVFLVHGVVVLVFSRARHWAWLLFTVVAGLCAWAVV